MGKRPNKHKHKEVEAAAVERPTQKEALAEALHVLGPDAAPAALARFVKKQFGMKLTFRILMPRAETTGKSASRQRCA
jgi:hypothetical protein